MAPFVDPRWPKKTSHQKKQPPPPHPPQKRTYAYTHPCLSVPLMPLLKPQPSPAHSRTLSADQGIMKPDDATANPDIAVSLGLGLSNSKRAFLPTWRDTCGATCVFNRFWCLGPPLNAQQIWTPTKPGRTGKTLRCLCLRWAVCALY